MSQPRHPSFSLARVQANPRTCSNHCSGPKGVPMRSMPRLLSMVTPVKAEVPLHTLPLAPDVLHRTPASEEASHPPRASLWVETISDSTRARRRDASISLSRGRWIRRRRPPADKNLQSPISPSSRCCAVPPLLQRPISEIRGPGKKQTVGRHGGG
jgi:hypothetical protein